MSRKRYPNTPIQNFFKWLYFGIFVIIAFWLLSSIFLKKSPTEVFRSSDTETDLDIVPYDTIALHLEKANTKLDFIEQKLAICRGEKQYKKALIEIDSDHVNMRTGPSLSSDIILQIPDSSIVQIQFYDTEKYILNEKYGSWCKIIYAETEGWVWGNFLKDLE